VSEIVKYEQRDAVAVITMHRPESMNSFNTELRADVAAAFARLQLHSQGRMRTILYASSSLRAKGAVSRLVLT
jgi:enoyl-CoA hydratase/carnithine racemase